MPVKKIDINEFVSLAETTQVIDVRSPSEYNHAHFPKAHSLPLFDDEERKIIGTLYKQRSREEAIKKGLEFFGPKMRLMVEASEKIITENKPEPSFKKIIVHCWRGGMRSGAVAWLLDLYGFEVYQLAGGYKAFRNWVLEKFTGSYNFRLLGGYTGSGKTKVLHEFQRLSQPVIDLEGLANHKGSAFGALGEKEQPSQEMFENLLAIELNTLFKNDITGETNFPWVEDESQRIGKLNIPLNVWTQMRDCPIYFLDIDFESRLDYLVDEYGKFETERLINSIVRIQKKLGGLETKNAIGFLLEKNTKECFRILLNYYDKLYSKGLHNRSNLSALLKKIECKNVDAKNNASLILNNKEIVSWK